MITAPECRTLSLAIKLLLIMRRGVSGMSNTDDIVKIVYFDEGSATDYVQLKTGGSFMSEIARLMTNLLKVEQKSKVPSACVLGSPTW